MTTIVPVTFTYRSTAASKVEVSGDWDNWAQRVELHKVPGAQEEGQDLWEATKQLEASIKVSYKYILNGDDWHIREDLPTEEDEQGNKNNTIHTPDWYHASSDKQSARTTAEVVGAEVTSSVGAAIASVVGSDPLEGQKKEVGSNGVVEQQQGDSGAVQQRGTLNSTEAVKGLDAGASGDAPSTGASVAAASRQDTASQNDGTAAANGSGGEILAGAAGLGMAAAGAAGAAVATVANKSKEAMQPAEQQQQQQQPVADSRPGAQPALGSRQPTENATSAGATAGAATAPAAGATAATDAGIGAATITSEDAADANRKEFTSTLTSEGHQKKSDSAGAGAAAGVGAGAAGAGLAALSISSDDAAAANRQEYAPTSSSNAQKEGTTQSSAGPAGVNAPPQSSQQKHDIPTDKGSAATDGKQMTETQRKQEQMASGPAAAMAAPAAALGGAAAATAATSKGKDSNATDSAKSRGPTETQRKQEQLSSGPAAAHAPNSNQDSSRLNRPGAKPGSAGSQLSSDNLINIPLASQFDDASAKRNSQIGPASNKNTKTAGGDIIPPGASDSGATAMAPVADATPKRYTAGAQQATTDKYAKENSGGAGAAGKSSTGPTSSKNTKAGAAGVTDDLIPPGASDAGATAMAPVADATPDHYTSAAQQASTDKYAKENSGGTGAAVKNSSGPTSSNPDPKAGAAGVTDDLIPPGASDAGATAMAPVADATPDHYTSAAQQASTDHYAKENSGAGAAGSAATDHKGLDKSGRKKSGFFAKIKEKLSSSPSKK
ncbi:unnamed protein product [Jaminaea pallidilutea]